MQEGRELDVKIKFTMYYSHMLWRHVVKFGAVNLILIRKVFKSNADKDFE